MTPPNVIWIGWTVPSGLKYIRSIDRTTDMMIRAGIVYVPEARILALARAAGLSLVSRYLGGFL